MTTAHDLKTDVPNVRLAQKDIAFLYEIHHKQQQCQEDIQSLKAQLVELDEKIMQERDKLGLNNKPTNELEILDTARKRFNTDCKKGIEYLIEIGYFKDGGIAHEIAKFLFQQQNLSKANIGEYLGEHKPLNLQVLSEFVELHEFSGMRFDLALRKYLWSFRLPGESQKIDRMMEAFAKRYCTCNQGVFNSSDACYILAFSTIMLNTSLHNPSVQHKPTVEEFISMNRGIDNGADIPPDVLRGLYESISTEPFKIPDDEMGSSITFINPERQGWLTKEGGSNRTWKRRWVVLTNSCVYYFKTQNDPTPLGIIPLESLRVAVVVEDKVTRSALDSIRGKAKEQPGIYFEILGKLDEDGGTSVIKGCKTNSKGMVVQGNHKRYLFKADSPGECGDWVRCIGCSAAIRTNPFYDLYVSKRNAKRQSDFT